MCFPCRYCWGVLRSLLCHILSTVLSVLSGAQYWTDSLGCIPFSHNYILWDIWLEGRLNNSKVQLTFVILLFSRELFCSKSEYQIDDKNYFFTSIIDYFHHRAQNRCVQKICCSIKISLAFLEKKFICRLQWDLSLIGGNRHIFFYIFTYLETNGNGIKCKT